MYILVHENDITKESSVCECVFLSAENSLRNDFLSCAVRCGVYSALFAFSELLISVEWQCWWWRREFFECWTDRLCVMRKKKPPGKAHMCNFNRPECVFSLPSLLPPCEIFLARRTVGFRLQRQNKHTLATVSCLFLNLRSFSVLLRGILFSSCHSHLRFFFSLPFSIFSFRWQNRKLFATHVHCVIPST